MATYTDVSVDLSSIPAPTNNVQTLRRVDIKESAFNSTTFNKTIQSQLATDKMLEVLAMHVIAQDGLINDLLLYTDYNALVSNPGSNAQGVDGYVDGLALTDITQSSISSELPNLGVGVAGYGYMESSVLHSGQGDQRHVFVKAKDINNVYRVLPGGTLKLRFNLSAFTPSNEEFVDIAIWLRETTFNSGSTTAL